MQQARAHPIDEFDDLDSLSVDSTRLTRQERVDVIEAACGVLRQRGFPIPARYGPICDAFVEERIEYNELSRLINAPDLN